MSEFGLAVRGLFSELFLFFIVGFLLAGLISEFVPRDALFRYLGTNSIATLLRATLSGTVASLCSCGAIPIAVTLRKSGATRAAALTFLLAAPWAGFLQLIIFYRFLGLAGTAVIFLCALSVAFLTGIVLARLEERNWLEDPLRDVANKDPEKAGNCGGCGDHCESPAHVSQNHRRLRSRLLQAARQSWDAFLELWKYLAFGLVIASALKAFVPMDWIAGYLGSEARLNPVLTAVPVAAAVELCSEGFSIFAGQLYRMGATLAVVFVVVVVGVSTDFTELTVIWGKFGKRSLLAYLGTATLLALLFGLGIQFLGQL